MYTIVVGVNHRTAPVEIREKVSFAETELAEAMQQLQKEKSILENIILSTCNRTEIYVVADQLHTGRYYVKRFLANWFDLEIEALSPHLLIFENDAAIEHVMKVAAGIDSMILGETQILGQVRDSFLLAQQLGTTGTMFNELFKQAISLAKRAHAETAIGENAVSVSYAAVELAKKIFGSLKDKQIVIIGAGKMGQLAIKNLYGNGVGKVTVINRTQSKATELANQFGGVGKSMRELQCTLLEADIVISSTGAQHYVLDYELMKMVEKLRKGKPLFLVDIAVPRDLDPKISELSTVFLYDIDDLQGIVEANLAERQRAAYDIQLMIEKEVMSFKEWVKTLGVVPIISTLRKKALQVQAETMASIENKMPNLTEREKKVLSKHTKSIVNQLLKEPILQVKELATDAKAAEKLALFQQIFGITDEVLQEEEMLAQRAKERATSNRQKHLIAQPKTT